MKAKIIVKEVESVVMVPHVTTSRRYILEMSKDEAQTIMDILMFVGGNPERSRRGHCQSILSVLYSAIGLSGSSNRDDLKPLAGRIMFDDRPDHGIMEVK